MENIKSGIQKGGYGTITAGRILEVSSNTGIVKIINDNYKNNPKRFVDRIYNMGINKAIGLPIKGEGNPKFLIQMIQIGMV